MYQTSGNKILRQGKEMIMRGVSRPGLEYLYADISAMIPETIQSDLERIKGWGFNLVRLPLRDKHWFEDQNYRDMVFFWVQKIREHSMIVLLDLHNQGDNPFLDPFMIKRTDQKDALQFWKELATLFGQFPDIWFELFNEPHDIDHHIWWEGNEQYYGYKEILTEIRKHTNNICILGGLDWAYEWAFLPVSGFFDELKSHSNIVLSTHPYGYRGKPQQGGLVSQQIPVKTIFPTYQDSFSGDCRQGMTIPLVPKTAYGWNESFGFLHADGHFPVIATEFGLDRPDTALQGGWYPTDLVSYFNEINMGYVAWAWVQDRLDYPSLIDKDFQPTGMAFKDNHGPACSSVHNGFYEGPGRLVWKDLQTNSASRRLTEESTLRLHPSGISFPWVLFLPLIVSATFLTNKFFKKTGSFCKTKTGIDECRLLLQPSRVFSDSNIRNRSSHNLL